MRLVEVGLIAAMKEEAEVIATALHLLPTRSKGNYLLYQSPNASIVLITPGINSSHTCFGKPVSRVGKVSAGIVTTYLIGRYHPKLLINAGTAGGVKSSGAKVGDIIIANSVANHDMRFGHPGYQKYGNRKILLSGLDKLSCLHHPYKLGLVSSGEAFLTSPEDWQIIKENQAIAKDMEAAGVVQACEILAIKTPLYILKAVTDLTDTQLPDSPDDFVANFNKAMAALTKVIQEIIDNRAKLMN